ncbi:hypothetical protein I4U23_027470 [Adineta vaga]|nr:hypothetical protein I4U23_027470 [Adineta vaga]
MNSSCENVNENLIISFYFIGFFLTIIGILLNICSCLLFIRSKSLCKTPYGIFIIALSVSDIMKLLSEYVLHIIYLYIQHPFFVCSITWFLTLTTENLSYSFLWALGIERNLKIWTNNRNYLISRKRAQLISILIIIFIIIYDHPFLFIPYNVSYCFIKLNNLSILFSCDNAFYKSYGYKYSLSDLIFIETIGLNNLILPILIIITNIILIIGLKSRSYQRRNRLGTRKTYDWREQSVILYVFLSNITFIILTTPIGMLNGWSTIYNHKMVTNNISIILDLMEILHHCSHFPILLMTSSVIRTKTFQIIFHPRRRRHNLSNSRQSVKTNIRSKSSS